MPFIDRVQVKLISGAGGKGAVHFHRTRFKPRAGPDGGDGGRGGDLILSPDSSVKDLSHLKAKQYKAEDGKPGEAGFKRGLRGGDKILKIPLFTACYDLKGSILFKNSSVNQSLLKGGEGGKGNGFFKKARNQAPDFSQPGLKGEEKTVILDMKWPSHAVLIGRPASGKTALIHSMHPRLYKKKAISRKRPALFSYKTSPGAGYTIVDLPGLNPAGGNGFLKQAELSQKIIFVISLENNQDPFLLYQTLKKELLDYDKKNNSALHKKPSIVVLTGQKMMNKKIKWDPVIVKYISLADKNFNFLKELTRENE